MKSESREIIIEAIKSLAKKLNKRKYCYISEEDIRAYLYHKIITHYKHKIRLKWENKKKNKTFDEDTDAVHVQARILGKSGKSHLIDLLIYYSKSKHSIPIKYRNGKVHFLRTSPKKTNKRRYLIEIGISKSERTGSTRIYKKIKSDFNKRKELDFEKCYLLYVDRNGNKFNDKTKEKLIKLTLKDNLKSKKRRFRIIYLGCTNKREKMIKYYFAQGKNLKGRI